MALSRIISPNYLAQNRVLHESPDFGASISSGQDSGAASIIAGAKHFQVKTILDFGCGKGIRAAAIRAKAPHLTVYEFDPAIPGKETLPDHVDMVIAMDVMEHIEPEYLDGVFETILGLKPKIFIATICLLPSSKTLPDGRNAHLIQKSAQWWENAFKRHFKIIDSQPVVMDRAYSHQGIMAEPLI